MKNVDFLLDKMPTYYLNKLEKNMARNRVYRSDSTILREPKQVEQMRESLSIVGKNSLSSIVSCNGMNSV